MVRAANARQNVIAEAQAKLRLMRVEGTHEGYTLRKIHDLALVRSEHPIFLLGWNLMHVIDESSALFGETPESLAARDAHDEIRWRHRYVDLMHDEDGITHIDYTHFHEVVPVDADTDERGSPGAVVNAGAATSARPRRRARGAVDSAAPHDTLTCHACSSALLRAVRSRPRGGMRRDPRRARRSRRARSCGSRCASKAIFSVLASSRSAAVKRSPTSHGRWASARASARRG